MSAEYYGVDPEVRAEVGRLLDLPALFSEQDWEFSLADPARIDDMLDLIAQGIPDLDLRSGLAQLLVASIDRAATDEVLAGSQLERAAAWFAGDAPVRDRMAFFWLEKGQSRNPRAVAQILGADPAPYLRNDD